MHEFYLTKFFQQLIFGKKGSGSILLMVLVYLLQLAAVMLVDGYLIHNIPALSPDDENACALYTRDDGPDFSRYIDGEILDTYGTPDVYHVLYRAESGEKKLVEISRNDIFFRYRVNRRSEITVPEDCLYEYDSGPGMTRLKLRIENDQIMDLSLSGGFQITRNNQLYGYMFLALVLLMVEITILNKLKGED